MIRDDDRLDESMRRTIELLDIELRREIDNTPNPSSVARDIRARVEVVAGTLAADFDIAQASGPPGLSYWAQFVDYYEPGNWPLTEENKCSQTGCPIRPLGQTIF